MDRNDHLELIQKYFRNELDPQEQERFRQLQHDPGFQEELAEFEFLHDLLEAGSLMEEEEAFIGKAAPEPGLGEPKPGASDPDSLSKQTKPAPEGVKIPPKSTEDHKPPPLQLRRSRVIRYTITASVLLLLVVGLAFYFNIRPSGLMTNAPMIASIAYQEVGDSPVRGLEDPDSTFTVKIYPSEEGYDFHYLFRVSDTLRLYGRFNPKDLMLQYNEARMEYQLMYQDKTYLLERKEEISPLVPASK